MKFRSHSTLFLVLLIISFAVRVGKVDYPLANGFIWGDGTRDYLVANHILKYQKFPLLGPFNLLFDSGIYGSPLYFYILALTLFFFNSVLTLSIINILLQLAVVVLIYQISKNLFGKPSAIIASTLFSFNPKVLEHSDFIWQPYLMQPIVYLALFFLIQAIVKKADFKLFLSFFLFAVAIAIHNSGFPWLPVFLVASFLVLKRDHKPSKYYLGTILTLIISTTIFNFPVVLYKLGQPNQISLGGNEIFVQSVGGYYSNLLSNSNQLLSAFGLKFQSIQLLILLIMIILYFLKIKDSTSQKRKTVLILILVLLPIFFASFFNKIRLHYLILSMGTFTIFTAKIISSYLRLNHKFRILRHSGLSRISLHREASVKDPDAADESGLHDDGREIRINILLSILLFSFFFKVFSSDFNFLKDSKRSLTDYKSIDAVTDNIKDELSFIQKKDSFSDFSFFQVRSFAKTKEVFYYPVLDTILLVPLENKLNQKLTKVSDTSPYNHIQIGSNQYLLVVCYQVECLDTFKKQHLRYVILKRIYGDHFISVYLAKLHG